MTALARTLRIGTRGSRLARVQTGQIVAGLGARSSDVLVVRTQGDRDPAPVSSFGGTGVFVSALRDALLEHRIDIAVHSFKDLPVGVPEGIALAAVPVREDPRDALVSRDSAPLDELPAGARIGTGSPRRAAQLRRLGRDLDVSDIRGNVDTRLGLVRDGHLDGVVVALAGLRRLGRDSEASEVFDPDRMLPAAAQGALAVECRADDVDALTAVRELDDVTTRAAATAERAVLAALQAGCAAPIGVLAELVDPGRHEAVDAGRSHTDSQLYVRGSVTAVDGSDAVAGAVTGAMTDAELVGRRLAAELVALGDGRIEKMMESSQ